VIYLMRIKLAMIAIRAIASVTVGVNKEWDAGIYQICAACVMSDGCAGMMNMARNQVRHG